ncbi:MAG: protein translocase subunit SecF, partial [Actinomycetota bacterium]|nr:protein translocase subunit SecF [Actinomycetota bacterium]
KLPVAGPAPTKKELLRQYKAAHNGKLPKGGGEVLAVPDKMVVISCGVKARFCPGRQGGFVPDKTYYYLFKRGNYKGTEFPAMKGGDLKLSGTRADVGTQGEGPVVLMQFTKEGNEKFHEITRAEYQRGQQLQRPQHFAIVLDYEMRSFPQIDPNDPRLSDGIDPTGTGAQIEGIESFDEAKELALVLQTGALPVTFIQKERTDVSATLGKHSLEQAQKAALAGLLVVALFLLVFYRFLGLVAVIGLAIYSAFLYAVIVLLGVTMTLPGFAGLILTIGVAADANIVVFERIKEEARAGKSIRAAISAGYGKGFHTILDANVVTLITAFVLFAVATAGVKGFALMLIIGTILSLVTAVAATRAMLGLIAGFGWFQNPRFMGAHGQQGAKWLQIDFLGRRYVWLAASGVVLAVAIGSLGLKGLNLGIDFKGGSQVSFKTPEPQTVGRIQGLEAIEAREAVVQGRGKAVAGEGYKSFQIRTKTLGPEQTESLKSELQNELRVTNVSVETVSSSFGRQIARSALIAIFFSLFLIVLYLAVRFDVKYAGPVVAALIHDVLVTVGIYSLTGREVTTATVAAVLTVLGYSIYDTIIIFDRIRENVPLMRRSSFAAIANVSLWETIRRSLATTFITLLPVGALLAFGGETLKDFALALLVGIGSGAYSSIFIAAPLLTMWKEREPEWAKRRGQDAAEKGGAVTGDGAAAQLEEAQEAAAAAPTPTLSPVPAVERITSDAKRERRRQRRRARPHGRAR